MDATSETSEGTPFSRIAVFQPVKLSTLREEALAYIGLTAEFTRGWLIEEDDGGPYVGQVAWIPPRDWEIGWVPDEDLIPPATAV